MMIIHNHTSMIIEDKEEQLLVCLRKMFGNIDFKVDNIICTDLVDGSLNFTTSGIYHLQGIMEAGGERLPWAIVLKVIKPDSSEKDHIQHHNYWRREAYIFESNLLYSALPEFIQTPQHYLVEEQDNGAIWLWMEYVHGELPSTQEHFDLIAYRLGMFNAHYLTEKLPLPNEPWICSSWLQSWTASSRKYAPDPVSLIDRLQDKEVAASWNWFREFTADINDKLESLSLLPRVLAHQDLSYKNMILNPAFNRLVLVDWQFMSISGIGEDLGKMVGVNMSLGPVPIEQYASFSQSLFQSYIRGLRDTGWQGDVGLARYGFCLSMALRSVWEVPQLCSLTAQLEKDPLNSWLTDRVSQLKKINAIHQCMADEAEQLKGRLVSAKSTTG